MKLALRCEKCRNVFMPDVDKDITLSLDFYEKKIEFFCPTCKHNNILDIANWQKKQVHSPLPIIGVMH